VELVRKFYENYKNLTTHQNSNLDLKRMLQSYSPKNRWYTDIFGKFV